MAQKSWLTFYVVSHYIKMDETYWAHNSKSKVIGSSYSKVIGVPITYLLVKSLLSVQEVLSYFMFLFAK